MGISSGEEVLSAVTTTTIRERTGQGARELGRTVREGGQEVASRVDRGSRDLRRKAGERTRDVRRRVGYWVAGEQPKRRTGVVVLAGVAGAIAAFFLDPVSGKRRRHVAKDWVAARVREARARFGRQSRWAAGHAYGAWKEATTEDRWPENDETLAHKVESEVLRGPDFPTGRILVNAENGVIVLRGTVGQTNQIDEIERAVRRVHGVRGVRNLLQTQGSPAHRG
jgi:hyperosmotically inducible periplasmic protein